MLYVDLYVYELFCNRNEIHPLYIRSAVVYNKQQPNHKFTIINETFTVLLYKYCGFVSTI